MANTVQSTGGIADGGGGGTVTSVNSGTGITVDNTDPANPIVNFTGSVQAPITVVANYSALPAAGTVSGKFYWASASQGAKWLPGALGGTYYDSGLYYSNGVTWEYLDVPYQATQSTVNTGTNTDQFVTPATLANYTGLTGKIASVSGTTNRITSTGGTTPVIDISATFEALLGKVANPLSQFASTTSAQLAGVLSDETGGGVAVFNNTPTLISPVLGTPTSGNLSNCTALPLGSITGFGTGVATTLATNLSITGGGTISLGGFTLTIGGTSSVNGTNTGDQTSVSGNAGSATTTAITDDTTTNATMYPTWVTANTGNLAQKVSSTKLSFNPSTGTLTSTAFAGSLTGNVTGNVTGTSANVTGVVAPANGGTGTSTVFTQGSVIFADASGFHAQDNANFFWDATNHRLGINNAAPAAELHVATALTSAPRGILSDQYSTDSSGNRFTLRKARGTFGSPTVITTADILSNFTSAGYDGSAFIDAAKIIITSTGTISTGVVPTTMKFQTMTAAGLLTTGITIDATQQTTFAGHIVVEGVTSTGATGTAKLVFATTPTFTTNITAPLVIGGTGTTSTLTFRTTSSGSGTTGADFIWQSGNNGATELMRLLNAGRLGIGVTAPTALIHLAAGTASASTAPLKFTSGTNLTTAEAGAMEYNGTNLFFTRTGTTRESIICANAVNSVSPTSPNRTITAIIDGTTYYLAAKTTND